MATRPLTQSSNRPGSYGGGGGGANSVDVGSATVARMAREDTRWFIAAVVVLSLVLFLALPLSLLIYVDTLKTKSMVQAERREVERMKREVMQLKKQAEKPPEE